MHLSELMTTTPQNLAERQLEALSAHAIGILKALIESIKVKNFKDVPLTFFSPAGDGYGRDNYCINFAYNKDETMDIAELMEKLELLRLLCAEKPKTQQMLQIPSKSPKTTG